MSKKKKKTSRHLFVVDVGAIEGPAQHAAKELGGSFIYTENYIDQSRVFSNISKDAAGRPSKQKCLKAVEERFRGGKSLVVLGCWTLPDISRKDLKKLGLKPKDVTYLCETPYHKSGELQKIMGEILEQKAKQKSFFQKLKAVWHGVDTRLKNAQEIDSENI